MKKRDIQPNDLVLVAEANIPRAQWVTGRVLDVNRGRDGHVCSVQVKTTLSPCLTRPIVKICLLEATVMDEH